MKKRENGREEDEFFMRRAIALAKSAAARGNEPFGALLVRGGRIVCERENEIYTAHDFTRHAEVGLIEKFCAETGIADLGGYTLYSGCEPCCMCCGAMVWAKLGRLVYGASDRDLCALLGEEGCDCCGTVFRGMGRGLETLGGVLREESLDVLRAYFARRTKN